MKMQYNEDGTPFIEWGGNKIELELQPIHDKFFQEKAETELRETPENVENGLKKLRELLKGETDLNLPIDNDAFLMKFLRPCKFYPESAFKKIQKFYKFRQNHEEYCRDLTPKENKAPFKHSNLSILSPRDSQGRRILNVDSGAYWNHREVTLNELFRSTQLCVESAMAEPRTQVAGVVAIIDLQGLSLGQVMQFTPSFAKMIIDWIQDCVPVRLKAVHIVNQPYIFNMLFAIFKPFMREKLRSRIFFHGTNMKTLLEHVDANSLRQRHGGSLPDPEVSGEILWQMLYHYEDSYKEASSYGYSKKV